MRRPDLMRRLTETREARLAVVVAPPGYGKTTALRQWSEQDQREFIWLTVDEDHADDVALSVRLMVADRAHSFVLVLDDAQLVAPAVLTDLVGSLVTELPLGSMVAVSSRVQPALPLGRLRASRALVEVGVQDLEMTSAQASLVLHRAGLQLGFAGVQWLRRRVEGWPVGLVLAAASLRDQENVPGALARFGGDDHRISEYFRDEVLPALTPELVTFCIRVSVLDELSGSLCDAVLGRAGSARMLEAVAKANPFLRPLDQTRERYRWHALCREALQSELRRSEPELECRLHRRASDWHRARGDVDRAIEHAVRAREPALAGDLLWQNVAAYISQGRNDLVQRWLRDFTTRELEDHAALALSAAHSCAAAGDSDHARHWSVVAQATLDREWPGQGASSLRAGLAVIDALVACDGAARMGEAATEACGLESSRAGPWVPLCLFLRGTALYLTGDSATAEELLQQSIDLSAAQAPGVTLLGLAQAAMIALEHKDWERADELTDRAEHVLTERSLAADPMSALAFAALAATRAHDGRVDEAKRHLRTGTDLLATLGEVAPWYGAEARVLLGYASLWLADIVAARTLLADASRSARRVPDATVFRQWFETAWAHMDTLAETRLAGASSLTIAELRILRFLPSHRSFREIAGLLGVSANTVKTQAHAVYRKLGAASRSEAVARASDAGLLGE